MRRRRSVSITGTRRLAGLAAAAAVLALGVGACGDDGGGGGSSGGGGGGGGGEEPYIAIVSKGFQHQFWQAVKQGAEEEADKVGARITFEGPPTEQDIEQQVTMLTNALQKNPDAIGFAALDSKASAPLMDQANLYNQINWLSIDARADFLADGVTPLMSAGAPPRNGRGTGRSSHG